MKAGRIVPALATTTASIAGLQALELVKILKGCKLEEFRNCFLNLAVPYMQCPEPGAVAKIKLLDGLEVGLWDRWEVKNAKLMTLEGMIRQLGINAAEYRSLTPPRPNPRPNPDATALCNN